MNKPDDVHDPQCVAPVGVVALGLDVRTTYRWLRLGLVVAFAVVATSVLVEWAHAPGHCLQPSLSAYYWTPVRPLFVGCLLALSLGMIALRGGTDIENVALNVAGLLVPFVAVIPIRAPTTGCSSASDDTWPAHAAIGNNVTSLLLVGAGALVALTVALVRGRPRTTAQWAGLAVALAVEASAALWFATSRSSFERYAHYVAATGLFLALGAVVWQNARATASAGLTRIYRGLVGAMALAGALQVAHLLWPAFGWNLLLTEILLVAAFTAFWLLQTRELWNQGIRPGKARSS